MIYFLSLIIMGPGFGFYVSGGPAKVTLLANNDTLITQEILRVFEG